MNKRKRKHTKILKRKNTMLPPEYRYFVKRVLSIFKEYHSKENKIVTGTIHSN